MLLDATSDVSIYMLPLSNIIHNHVYCKFLLLLYADDTQLHVSAKPDERHQFNKECVKDIRHWMLIDFILLNSQKTEGLHPKDLIDSSLSFKVHIDNITKIFSS